MISTTIESWIESKLVCVEHTNLMASGNYNVSVFHIFRHELITACCYCLLLFHSVFVSSLISSYFSKSSPIQIMWKLQEKCRFWDYSMLSIINWFGRLDSFLLSPIINHAFVMGLAKYKSLHLKYVPKIMRQNVGWALWFWNIPASPHKVD